jgi:hypothetical protein
MRAARIVAWIGLAALLLVSFWCDLRNVTQGGAIDLRNRITGARLLAHGIDPYHYKWSEGDPPEFCDPFNNPRLPVSKTTATPSLLLLEEPLAWLPYRPGQLLWFLAQWTLLLGTAAVWLRVATGAGWRLLIGAFVVGMTSTAAWRLHAERGQVYVLYMFMFAAWLVLTMRSPAAGGFLAGLAAGVLAALRPPFALLFPFIAWRCRGQSAGVATGFLVAVVAPMLFLPGCWLDYLGAMGTHSWLYRRAIDPLPGGNAYPPVIEGVPLDILAHYVALPYADFSLHGFFRWINLAPMPAWPFEVAAVAVLGGWFWLRRAEPTARLLPGLAAGLFLVDLVLPAYRNSYNDVLILDVFAVAIAIRRDFHPGVAACLLMLPLGWAIAAWAPEDNVLIDLPSLVGAIGCGLLLFWPDRLAFWRKGCQKAPC